jgi:8-oxo-dGTP diphosphatase
LLGDHPYGIARNVKRTDRTTEPVIAAGGIVLRRSTRPLVGIVQLRKDKSWVLPKGKLKPGERLLAAAKREVEEETGYEVTVHDFLGTLSHVADSKHKIVQFWHMQAGPGPVRPLMDDVRAVKWLPLGRAIETLSRPHEQAFLSNAGPVALKAAERARRATPLEPAPTMPSEPIGPVEAAVPLPIETETHEPAPPPRLGGTIAAWLRRLMPFTS